MMNMISSRVKRWNIRDLLPDTLDVTNFGLNSELAFRSDLASDLLDLLREIANWPIMSLVVLMRDNISPDTDTPVIFCVRSPLATAVCLKRESKRERNTRRQRSPSRQQLFALAASTMQLH